MQVISEIQNKHEARGASSTEKHREEKDQKKNPNLIKLELVDFFLGEANDRSDDRTIFDQQTFF